MTHWFLRHARGRLRTGMLVMLALLVPCVATPRAGAEEEVSLDERIERHLTAEQKLDLAFLRHLGWQLEFDGSAERVLIHGGNPCARPSLQAAIDAGDLRIRIPPLVTPEEIAGLGSVLADLQHSYASRCAYQQRVHTAVDRSTRKLSEIADRGIYVFPDVLFVQSPWFKFSPPQPEWGRRGKVHVAQTSSARAIESIYERGGVAECYAGQWIAAWAVQYELYGGPMFDQSFHPSEIVIGMPADVHPTAFGRFMRYDRTYAQSSLFIAPENHRKDPGWVLSHYGPVAFSGLTGIIQSPEDTNAANQNFLIVSISPKAVESLRTRGGFRWMNRLMLEVYPHVENATGLITELLSSSESLRSAREKAEAILSLPIFTEFMVYVQPYGVLSMRELIVGEMEEDHTPVQLLLYSHGREYAFYRRYIAAWKAWRQGRALAAPGDPPPPPPVVDPRIAPICTTTGQPPVSTAPPPPPRR